MVHQERRKYERYPQVDLVVRVARPGLKGILKVNPTGECLDFSVTGIGFSCNQKLKIGEKLIVDLEFHDFCLTELLCEVVSSVANENKTYCCHLRFCLEDKHMQTPQLEYCLLRIEQYLKNHMRYDEAVNR